MSLQVEEGRFMIVKGGQTSVTSSEIERWGGFLDRCGGKDWWSGYAS